MEIRRDSIYIGEVFKQDFFSLQCLRKILFTLDKNNNKGIDLMNIGIISIVTKFQQLSMH